MNPSIPTMQISLKKTDILARVTSLVSEDILLCEEGLKSDTNLFAAGLDSMAIMQLLLLIEEEFGIEIPVESVTKQNFETAGSITCLIAQRLGCPPDDDEKARNPSQATGALSREQNLPTGHETSKRPFTRWPLRNCDYFLVAFDAMMRARGDGGHVAHSVLELDSLPDAAHIRNALVKAVDTFPMLSAVIRRPWGIGLPRWKAGKAKRVPGLHLRYEHGSRCRLGALGGSMCENADAEIGNWINTRLDQEPGKKDARLRLVLIERKNESATLILSWNHLLLDGKGAEMLLQAMNDFHVSGHCYMPQLDEQAPKDTRGIPQLWKGAMPMIGRFDTIRKHKFDCLSGRRGAAIGPLNFEMRVLDESSTSAVKNRARIFGELVNLPFQLACAMRAHDAVFAMRGTRPESLMCSVPVQTRRKGSAGPIFQNHLVMFFGQCLRKDVESLEAAVLSLSQQYQEFMRERLGPAFDDLMRMMRLVPPGPYLRFASWQMNGLLNSFFHSDTGEFAPGMNAFLDVRIRAAYHIPGFSSPPGSGLFVNEKNGRLALTLCWRGETLTNEERNVMWKQWTNDLGANGAGA